MKIFFKIFLLASVCLHLNGCATIFGSKNRKVRVTSSPKSARISLDGNPMGRTPRYLHINDTNAPLVVTVSKKGYESESKAVAKTVQTIAFCNLFNLVCWGVDFLTGSIWSIPNERIHFSLEKAD